MDMNAEQLLQIIGKQTVIIEGLKATIQEMAHAQRHTDKGETPAPTSHPA